MPLALKNDMLLWAGGQECVTLIYNCISKKYYDVQTFQHIYKIIINELNFEGLFDKDKRRNILECIDVVSDISRSADYDELHCIYESFSDLMNSLIGLISRNISSKDIVEAATNAVLFLLNSYGDIVFDYANMGVAYLSGIMIVSNY